VAVYAGELTDGAVDRLRLAGELGRALDEGEIVLHYQPIAAMGSGALVAAEALVRWQHPERGLLGPCAFLPALERTDLMHRFSRHVLDRAIAQAAAWRAAGIPITVSVNLTAMDALDASLPGEVARLLELHGALAADLQVEVTESGVLSDFDRARAVLEAVRALGVRVALDDFGTGASSLTHLQRLPVDTLKIDRSFVASLADEPASDAIVTAVVQLAHTLGQVVVAEGVEDVAMWQRLAAKGCDFAQGWVVSPALPPHELVARFAQLDRLARDVARPDRYTRPRPASVRRTPSSSGVGVKPSSRCALEESGAAFHARK
jgi:EAL domain-containing protein (putative c-di-GMP-specific phosphodiesterase class I)